MPWKKLQDSLSSSSPPPLVLAGPILRTVTPLSVTVWLALQRACEVILTVRDANQAAIVDGSRKTIAIGKSLHIVAVTANRFVFPETTLKEGIVYRYDLEFKGLNMKLAQATDNADLGYPPNSLPSFALPPRDLNLLRLIQGSCRLPHAQGKDTLALVDTLIAETASNAYARPHQLLLTGDQIYADDVADSLLMMLTDAADTLLGWQDMLAVSGGIPLPAVSVHPIVRERLLSDAGFTSDDLRCHLMSFGEYLCMYLFAWSPVLWSPSPPSEAEALAQAIFEEASGGGTRLVREAKVRAEIKPDIEALVEFRRTLPEVRRALANIPSYMIFDDHEVTDDWNITFDFCRDIYGRPLGRRMVQNALAAYALCQHWGNAPEQFDGIAGPMAPAGLKLLEALDTNLADAQALGKKASDYDQKSKEIRRLLGVKEDAVFQGPENALTHDSDSLRYNFTIEGPGHQVIFTDTRTWRSFPNRGSEAPHLLSKDPFAQQILNTPGTRDRALLVVLSTNVPPVQADRAKAKRSELKFLYA